MSLAPKSLRPCVWVLGGCEVHARRADELGDDHALGAVDDEGAFVGHHGEVAHVDLGLLDLARLLDGEAGPDAQRRRVRHVAVAALLDGELGLPELVVEKLQLEVLAGVVGDRVDGGSLNQELVMTKIQENTDRDLGKSRMRSSTSACCSRRCSRPSLRSMRAA